MIGVTTTFMAAAKASLAALYPDRQVLRGLHDPAVLGDTALRQGVYMLVAEDKDGWAEYSGREGEHATLRFAVVGYIQLEERQTPEELEDAEAELEQELLAWCQASKAPPLDAVYPQRVTYSGGLEHPYGWIVMRLQALYI